MIIPAWVQTVLEGFENKAEPFSEIEIVDALDRERKNHGDLSDEHYKGYLAERSAFMFRGQRDERIGDTFYGPMATLPRDDGTAVHVPDIRECDAEMVAHWEKRALAAKSAVMRARYADLVWDLTKAITGKRASYHAATTAIDAYLLAMQERRHTMELEGVHWLQRSLDIAAGIHDQQRTAKVISAIFSFYDMVAQPQKPGVWVFLFDTLYGRKEISQDQEDRIIKELESMLARTAGTTPGEFDPFGAEAAADRLARHYQKKNDKAAIRRVIKAYGEAFARLAKDASPMLATSWLQPVIERYQQEGMKQEAEELHQQFAQKAKHIREDFKEYSTPVRISQEVVDKLIEDLLADNLTNALLLIADYFVPKTAEARELLEKMQTNTPLLASIRMVKVAPEGHPTATIGSIEDDAEGRLHQQLGQIMSLSQGLLALTLQRLGERFNPSVDEILAFLSASPLFATSRTDLLREGLTAYQQKDFVKAIHILVPEIEHLLRSFLPMLGIPPLKVVPRHPGIMDAKSMNDVLSDERVQQALSEDLWRYLAVLYIDRKGGMNLRNDLAHGIISPEAFNQRTADRVFHSLLALSLIREQKTDA